MKHLQKPIFPLLILILILSAFGYREFANSYTQTEKEILKYSYEQNQTIKNDFLDRIKDKKMENLEKIYSETAKKYFVNDAKIEELQLTTAFQHYVEKVSKVDSTIAKNYQNFVFEKGRTDSEINDFYFDTDSYLQAFHYSRFEVQLAQMYYEDVKTLIDKFSLSPYNLKIEDAKIIPIIIPKRKDDKFTGEYHIETLTCFPFEKQRAKIIFPKNIETTFDENGFIVIPKELRKGENTRFNILVPLACGKDTILSITMDFEYRKKYFEDEK
jgi:hypothetical protein